MGIIIFTGNQFITWSKESLAYTLKDGHTLNILQSQQHNHDHLLKGEQERWLQDVISHNVS